MTVKALDRIFDQDDLNEEDTNDVVDLEQKQRQKSAGWMKMMVEETMKGQLQSLHGMSPDQRTLIQILTASASPSLSVEATLCFSLRTGISGVLEESVEHFAVDVKGKFAKAGINAPDTQLARLIEKLSQNCDEAQQRRQRFFLEALVNSVLLPFHAQCLEVLKAKQFENSDCGMSLPAKARWLEAFKNHASSKLDRETMVRSIRKKSEGIIDPKTQLCTTAAVKVRFNTEAFAEYMKGRTRILGEHLKAERPESLPSKLRQLVIPDLTDEPTVLQLADMLREQKTLMLFDPLKELELLLLQQLDGMNSQEGTSAGSEAGHALIWSIKDALKKHVKEMKESFSHRYDQMIADLPNVRSATACIHVATTHVHHSLTTSCF